MVGVARSSSVSLGRGERQHPEHPQTRTLNRERAEEDREGDDLGKIGWVVRARATTGELGDEQLTRHDQDEEDGLFP